MATFVLIPGAGGDASYWHLVEPRLRRAGHDVVAVDLPGDDDAAGLGEYADVAVRAIGDRTDVVLVAQSLGGFTAPLVCARRPVDLMVLVAAMIPAPGESPGEWWSATGAEEARRAAAVRDGRDPDRDGPEEWFLHDVPPEALAGMGEPRDQSGTPFGKPWPLEVWPDAPTRALLCRDDRFFPADFQRRLVRERLGFVPDEMDGGHLPALARPGELVDRLLAYRAEWEAGRTGGPVGPASHT